MKDIDPSSPLGQARTREANLAGGLRTLAERHSVKLREPLRINANGEFNVIAEGATPYKGCSPYGSLAAVLNRHNPRTGVQPGACLLPESGWCYMNHFDVERMLTTEGI
jgi:hypothetical protein